MIRTTPRHLHIARIITACAFTLLVPIGLAAQHDHDHQHGEGHDGSTGGLDRWLPHLEGEDRAGWQKPGHIIDLMEIREGMRIVDLGAGTGYFLESLATAAGPSGSVEGLDVDAELVDYMNQRAHDEGWSNVSARQVNPNDPEFDAGTIDRILIVNTWHHLPDRESYAAKLAKSLKPGGSIWVVDLTMDSPHGPPKDHRLAPDVVQAEMEAGGLTTQIVGEDLQYQYVVVAMRDN